ncbi:MAG: nitrogen regulation protein NR(II) [Pseudomonadales bacterium]|nr:nitrogen regulation protein NR(II) [Pseudomonadales bacterium]
MSATINSQKILENLCEAVLLFNEQLNVIYMNPAAEALLAVSFIQAGNQPIEHFLIDAESSFDELHKSVDRRQPYTRRQVDLLVVSSQRHIVVDFTVTPIEVASRCQLLLEISPLDRLLKISREEALFSSQQTSRSLVRGVAHEIKNPLGGIRGAAQLLSRELDTPELLDYTTVIIEEADRLRALVDRMLGSNKPLNRQWVNIHEVLERVYTLISVESNNDIRLERDYDPSIPEVFVDKEQMIQALLNVVRNAKQSIEQMQGERKGVITISSRTQRQFTIGKKQHRLVCRIDVVDNGPGIPDELINDIFYPMISGRAEGTGLGLSISQTILAQHGGLIECESTDGLTRFSLILPLECK